MVIAITLTGQQDMLVRYLYVVERLFLHVLVNLILDNQLRHCRERIGHIDLQVVLVTIEGEYGYLLRV